MTKTNVNDWYYLDTGTTFSYPVYMNLNLIPVRDPIHIFVVSRALISVFYFLWPVSYDLFPLFSPFLVLSAVLSYSWIFTVASPWTAGQVHGRPRHPSPLRPCDPILGKEIPPTYF